MTPVDIDKLKAMIARFPDDVTDVQSRIILAHQLRASADIQDAETKSRTGWADTTDRAERDRIAATAIELLDAALIAKAERVDALTEALKPFAALRLSTEVEVSDLLHRTPAAEARRHADAIERRDAEILAARNALSPKESE